MSRIISLSEWKLTTRASEGREQWELDQEELLMRMIQAVEASDTAKVDALLRDGAPLNLPLHGEVTVLGLAASKNDVAMMRHLINKGASITTVFAGGKDAAWLAMESNARHAFELLMKLGARPSQRLLATRETRLIAATELSNVDVVRYLAHLKINLNEHDNEGRTALHHNLAKDPYGPDDLEIARILLAQGCDPNQEDLRGLPAHALAHNAEQRVVLEGHELSMVAEEALAAIRTPDPALEDMEPPEPDIPPPPVTPIRKPRRRL